MEIKTFTIRKYYKIKIVRVPKGSTAKQCLKFLRENSLTCIDDVIDHALGEELIWNKHKLPEDTYVILSLGHGGYEGVNKPVATTTHLDYQGKYRYFELGYFYGVVEEAVMICVEKRSIKAFKQLKKN